MVVVVSLCFTFWCAGLWFSLRWIVAYAVDYLCFRLRFLFLVDCCLLAGWLWVFIVVLCGVGFSVA